MAVYHCKNFVNCGKADSREDIDLPEGAEQVCPECGRGTLETVGGGAAGPEAGSRSRLVMIGVAGVALVVVIAVVAVFAYRRGKPAGPTPAPSATMVPVRSVETEQPTEAAATLLPPAAPKVAGLEVAAGRIAAKLKLLRAESEEKLLAGDASGARAAAEAALALETAQRSLVQLANGAPQQAQRVLDETPTEVAERLPWAAFVRAAIAATSGERDAAITLLEKAAGGDLGGLPDLVQDPCFDALRGDPRFERLASGSK